MPLPGNPWLEPGPQLPGSGGGDGQRVLGLPHLARDPPLPAAALTTPCPVRLGFSHMTGTWRCGDRVSQANHAGPKTGCVCLRPPPPSRRTPHGPERPSHSAWASRAVPLPPAVQTLGSGCPSQERLRALPESHPLSISSAQSWPLFCKPPRISRHLFAVRMHYGCPRWSRQSLPRLVAVAVPL